MHNSESEEEEDLSCNFLVNTAGPWAAELALMAGVGDAKHPNPALRVPLPVSPRKRCVFVFRCPAGPENCPLVVDSGFFFRKETSGRTFLTGITPLPVSISSRCE